MGFKTQLRFWMFLFNLNTSVVFFHVSACWGKYMVLVKSQMSQTEHLYMDTFLYCIFRAVCGFFLSHLSSPYEKRYDVSQWMQPAQRSSHKRRPRPRSNTTDIYTTDLVVGCLYRSSVPSEPLRMPFHFYFQTRHKIPTEQSTAEWWEQNLLDPLMMSALSGLMGQTLWEK